MLQARLARLPPFVIDALQDFAFYQLGRHNTAYSYLRQRIRTKYQLKAALLALGTGSVVSVQKALRNYFNSSTKEGLPSIPEDSTMDTPMYQAGGHGSNADGRLKRRMRTGGTQTVNDPNDGGAVVTFNNDVCGRRLPHDIRLMKMLGAGITTRVDRWCRLTDTTANSGAMNLSFFNRAVDTRKYLPFYCMDLTSINQSATGILGGVLPCPMLRLFKQYGGSGVAEFWAWDAVTHLAVVDGTTPITAWETVEGRNAGVTAGAAIKRAFIGEIDIGMVITGATKFSSAVIIQLIQFTDEDYCPPLYTTTNATGAAFTAQEDVTPFDELDEKEHDDFWTNIVDGLVMNPLNDKNYKQSANRYNVIYKKVFRFNPTTTTESNADGHDAVFKLRYNMDKVISYDLSPYTGNDVEDTALENVNREQVTETAETLYPTCHKKGRVFLVIKGTAPSIQTAEPTGTTLTENYCSFDLKVHRTLYKLRAENMS